MQSNFDAACKQARSHISVPAFPLAAVRAACARPAADEGKRRKPLLIGLALAGSMAAIAAAAVVGGAHLQVTPNGGLVLDTAKLSMKYNPTGAQVSDAVKRAAFPVTLPTGLPAGVHLRVIVLADPNALILQYDMPGAQRRSNHVLTVFLADPSAVSGNPAKVGGRYQLQIGRRRGNRGHQWRAGGEQVFVVANDGVITDAELAAMKAAMLKAAR